jgi:hypothetical protein
MLLFFQEPSRSSRGRVTPSKKNEGWLEFTVNFTRSPHTTFTHASSQPVRMVTPDPLVKKFIRKEVTR